MPSSPLPDSVTVLGDLINCGLTLVMVRRMPPEFGGWILDDDVLYVLAPPPLSGAMPEIREALKQVAPTPRAGLVVLDGGLSG